MKKTKRILIFERFLDEVERFDEFHLFCYGGYEKAFLNRMRKRTARVDLADRVISSLINTLSSVYTQFYFPCYSNGLKDVARCLGFQWTSEGASGVQSIAWRMRWEATRDEEWKRMLITYNMEDCLALKTGDGVHPVGRRPVSPRVVTITARGKEGPGWPGSTRSTSWRTTGSGDRLRTFIPNMTFINSCARFDYQREHVYVRTGKRTRKRTHEANLRLPQQEAAGEPEICDHQHEMPLLLGYRHRTRYREEGRRTILPSEASVRSRHHSERAQEEGHRIQIPRHRCRGCGERFIPESYRSLDKHYHNLKSWAMYLHVAHRLSFHTLHEIAKEFFGLTIHSSEFVVFKNQFARTYRATYDKLLGMILAGQVLHVDETEVKLKTGKGYVWVFASNEEVIYMYRPTREGDFLKEFLKDFHGVLVSDFYAAYDVARLPPAEMPDPPHEGHQPGTPVQPVRRGTQGDHSILRHPPASDRLDRGSARAETEASEEARSGGGDLLPIPH